MGGPWPTWPTLLSQPWANGWILCWSKQCLVCVSLMALHLIYGRTNGYITVSQPVINWVTKQFVALAIAIYLSMHHNTMTFKICKLARFIYLYCAASPNFCDNICKIMSIIISIIACMCNLKWSNFMRNLIIICCTIFHPWTVWAILWRSSQAN